MRARKRSAPGGALKRLTRTAQPIGQKTKEQKRPRKERLWTRRTRAARQERSSWSHCSSQSRSSSPTAAASSRS